MAGDATPAACRRLTRLLGETRGTASAHRKAANHVQDGRGARTFVTTHPWAHQPPRQEARLTSAVDDLLRQPATVATLTSDGAVLDSYTAAFATACGAAHELAATHAATRGADAAIRKLRRRAAHAPWWPPGYKLIADGVAYQALAPSEYSCDLFGCLKIRVVTRDGCGTLYVEEKVIDSHGQVVGFSNDVLSALAPNEIGIMEFTVTNDGPGTLQISDVSCY